MKRLLMTLLACVGLVAGPAIAGVFTITAPGPLNTTSIHFDVANNDGFELLNITFDLGFTQSNAPGNPPLVFGGAFNVSGPPGGTATGFGSQGDSLFGFDFTGFDTGESFSFDWDPDIATDGAYGAVLSELVGTRIALAVQLPVGIGTVDGVLQVNATRDGLIAIINSPGTVPEPASVLLFGAALAGLGFVRRRSV